MSKAEEKLLEKARKFSLACATSLERNGKSLCWSDLDIAYIKGYRQAEKDLALTVEDVQLLCKIESEVDMEYCKDGVYSIPIDDVYKEILRRFNERKE